jgi:hypothetical protein
MYFIPFVKPLLIHWFWLRWKPFSWTGLRLTTGVTGRQLILTPPSTWSHLWYFQRSMFALYLDLYFLQVLWDWLLFVIYAILFYADGFTGIKSAQEYEFIWFKHSFIDISENTYALNTKEHDLSNATIFGISKL